MKAIRDIQPTELKDQSHDLEKNIIANEVIRKFIKKEKITKNEFSKNFGLFLTFLDKIEQCQNCLGLHTCSQNIIGHSPILVKSNNEIAIHYLACEHQKQNQAKTLKENNLTLIGINRKEYDDLNVYVNDNRFEILNFFKLFLSEYPKTKKGMFLRGPYGCGKTYLFTHLTKSLVDKGAKVLFAYYPSLVGLIKSSIGTAQFDQIIEELKTVEILILDDFGGEMTSTFVRDEILSPVLQERMVHQRPLFMTSNLDEKSLQEHLAEGNRSLDKVRALRIFERIKTLMYFYDLNDRNYR